MTVNFLEPYAPAEAERGKFVPVAGQTLDANYPLSGRGKYAILTYGVNTFIPSPSGTPVPTNNTVLNQSQTITAGILVPINFGATVNYIEIYNNDQRGGLPLTYVSLDNPLTFATLSANGIILNKTSFYTVNFETPTIWVGASGVGSVDLRIKGHRAV